ncbi:NBS-containing resistance-like protein, partial [Trifolium medium]|nr:NBS-containing resistance-like protein [Trifolium medium]
FHIKGELESIQAFLKDADRRAVAQAPNISEMNKIWVKQVREVAFRIEDVVDEYMLSLWQQPQHSGCAALLQMITHMFKTLIQRHQIASKIKDIKSSMCGIKERSKSYNFKPSFEQGSSSSSGSQKSKLHPLREAALYIDEADIVGFEEPRKKLIDWISFKGRENPTVISVVGMGGQGKTTLVKKVFDDKDVIKHFDCRVWITVSQTYDVKEVLREMLRKGD